jgi:AcrR family transcriptional regulator
VAGQRPTGSLRAEQVAVTRRRILAAAGAEFLAKGYVGTTLAEVGRSAGVSVQTLYNVVGGKAQLLKAVYDVTLAGDDEPVPMAQRPLVRAVLEASSGRECLVRYAVMGRVLGERTLPLVTTLLAQAASGDPDLASFAETIEHERAVGTAGTARHVAERFGLREGLDVDQACDVLWALTSPDLADRLVRRRGWGWDRFETWLGTAMADALLGPDG